MGAGTAGLVPIKFHYGATHTVVIYYIYVMPQTRHILAWVAVGAWMGLIWYLSDQPDLKSNLEQDFLLRKLAHVTEFAVLTSLVRHAGQFSWSRRSAVVLAIVWATIYAGLDEWHQSWVMGRHGALADVGIDVIGIVIAISIWLALTKTTARAGSGSTTVSK